MDHFVLSTTVNKFKIHRIYQQVNPYVHKFTGCDLALSTLNKK